MKKLILIIQISLFLINTALPKDNIAILDLVGKNVPQTDASILSDKMRSEIVATNIYNIVERFQMEEILKEQGLQQSGCMSDECAVEIGRLLGVEKIIAGTIGRLEGTFYLTLRLISVETGQIIKYVDEGSTKPINKVLFNSIPSLVEKLLEETEYPYYSFSKKDREVDLSVNSIVDDTYFFLSDRISSSFVQVNRVTKGIMITIPTDRLFESGDIEVSQTVYPLFQVIGEAIKSSPINKFYGNPEYSHLIENLVNKNYELKSEIRCEVHTDNVPLHTSLENKHESKWHFSALRAVNIAQLIKEYSGIKQSAFNAIGYGGSRPVASNDTFEGRAMNRRAVIFLDAYLSISIKQSLYSP